MRRLKSNKYSRIWVDEETKRFFKMEAASEGISTKDFVDRIAEERREKFYLNKKKKDDDFLKF